VYHKGRGTWRGISKDGTDKSFMEIESLMSIVDFLLDFPVILENITS